jgi:hypothetical protein
MAREREFRVTPGVSKCGGFRAKPVVIGLLCALGSSGRMLDSDRLAEREGFEPRVRLRRAGWPARLCAGAGDSGTSGPSDEEHSTTGHPREGVCSHNSGHGRVAGATGRRQGRGLRHLLQRFQAVLDRREHDNNIYLGAQTPTHGRADCHCGRRPCRSRNASKSDRPATVKAVIVRATALRSCGRGA